MKRANWVERQDVRFVRYMSGKGPLNNEWMTVAKCGTIGPEFGLAHFVGDAMDTPVMILKSCIGNRSLGWDLLPPGSERYEFVIKDRAGVEKTMVYAGYKDRPESWEMDKAKGLATEPPPWLDRNGKPIDWYAGKQWDDDIRRRKEGAGGSRKALPREPKATRSPASSSGRARKTPATPDTRPNTKKTSSVSSKRCGRNSTPPTRNSCSARWANP